jgi:two-component system chemotaxis response regulator CheB
MITVPNRARVEGSCAGAVAIVASAGGIPALIELLSGLPSTFPLPIFVSQHLPRGASELDRILAWRCALPVRWAHTGANIQEYGIHLACPGTGIHVTPGGMELETLDKPSTSWLASGDRMIESVHAVYGPRTVAIVLSGALPAGVDGIRLVKAGGGITMAQDRRSAIAFAMPSAAIDLGKAEIVCAPGQMARMLALIAEDWQEADAEPEFEAYVKRDNAAAFAEARTRMV